MQGLVGISVIIGSLLTSKSSVSAITVTFRYSSRLRPTGSDPSGIEGSAIAKLTISPSSELNITSSWPLSNTVEVKSVPLYFYKTKMLLTVKRSEKMKIMQLAMAPAPDL